MSPHHFDIFPSFRTDHRPWMSRAFFCFCSMFRRYSFLTWGNLTQIFFVVWNERYAWLVDVQVFKAFHHEQLGFLVQTCVHSSIPPSQEESALKPPMSSLSRICSSTWWPVSASNRPMSLSSSTKTTFRELFCTLGVGPECTGLESVLYALFLSSTLTSLLALLHDLRFQA